METKISTTNTCPQCQAPIGPGRREPYCPRCDASLSYRRIAAAHGHEVNASYECPGCGSLLCECHKEPLCVWCGWPGVKEGETR